MKSHQIWTTECYIIGNNKISNINIDFPQNLQRHNHTDEQINFLWLLPLDEHAPPFLGSEFQVFFFPEVKIRIHLNGVVSYQLVTNYNFWPPLLLRTVTVQYCMAITTNLQTWITSFLTCKFGIFHKTTVPIAFRNNF